MQIFNSTANLHKILPHGIYPLIIIDDECFINPKTIFQI